MALTGEAKTAKDTSPVCDNKILFQILEELHLGIFLI